MTDEDFDHDDAEAALADIHTLPVEGVVGQCFQCDVDIHYGEWHVALDTDTSKVPRDTGTRVMCGSEDDDIRRLCGPCSERSEEEFPDDAPTAGV